MTSNKNNNFHISNIASVFHVSVWRTLGNKQRTSSTGIYLYLVQVEVHMVDIYSVRRRYVFMICFCLFFRICRILLPNNVHTVWDTDRALHTIRFFFFFFFGLFRFYLFLFRRKMKNKCEYYRCKRIVALRYNTLLFTLGSISIRAAARRANGNGICMIFMILMIYSGGDLQFFFVFFFRMK